MAQKTEKKNMINAGAQLILNHLSYEKIELLSKANDKIKDNNSGKFGYADMHGILKIVLQNLLKRKFLYSFNTEIEPEKILFKLYLQYQERRDSDVEK